MTRLHNSTESSDMPGYSYFTRASKRLILATLLLCTICIMLLVIDMSTAAAADKQNGSFESANFTFAPDYSKFSHKSPSAHEAFAKPESCGTCHRRNDGSLEPRFPRHKDCIGCHLVQFTAFASETSVNPICTICHKAEGLNSSTAPLKNFSRLVSFTAAFDHAQHLKGIETAKPSGGCAACHRPARRAQTIPARLNAHQICYQCHSAGKQASNLSSCETCHRLGPYSPTSTMARAYRVGFSHADHGPRQQLSCDRCHNLRERGLPQTRQVTSIVPAQHYANPRGQNCATCHNGQRVFGDHGPNFDECKRCHKGLNFGI